ncbi:hypothetical protein HME9302_02421 [Alteripontixanthobacter maritimus]|uniref:CysZ-like protein n=1 Tax=Alteripontixanthobacter maritimus TaxID=2161824 RepID=A0A369Q9P7_9SPHN|nr:EI24 domain-containing protein [Alteripontixanthobacter maritimus]RDC61202.1 hypothetical protein HME9302_02421 [Alteripontixanthobacter maritimus]
MPGLSSALAKAVGQLTDPAILRVLAKSLAVTLAVFGLLGALLYWTVAAGLRQSGWELGEEASALISLLGLIIGGWLLFRLVAIAVLQMFAGEVVRAVEARHYPQAAAAARDLPFLQDLAQGLRSTGRALLVNLAALPFAAVLLVTGFGTVVLFGIVNAVLLGRELQDMVWLRHRPQRGIDGEPAGTDGPPDPLTRSQRFAVGGATAALFAIPFANLLAPIIGAATATHLVHRASGSR